METTEGWRPGSSGGERILVALAAIALVGGVLIVAGNLLPHEEDAVSVASPSPRPTAGPSPTPRPTMRPTPAPLDLVLESAAPPAVDPYRGLFYGWIRARVDLPIRTDPGPEAASVGVLAAGELAYGSEQPDYLDDDGWVQVDRPGTSGWVATRQAGADLVDRYVQQTSAVSGSIWQLAAGPDGFVGIGQASGTSDPWPPTILIHSADGARWEVTGGQGDMALYPSAAAWGPAGWLLVSGGPDGGAWFSTSPDGSRWTMRGTLVTPGGAPYPSALVASGAGYLLRTGPYDYAQREILWFSTNGVNWLEVDPGINASGFQFEATTAGFYAWTDHGCCPHEAAFSADGRTWSDMAGGPQGLGLRLAAIGDRWFAIETDPATGAPRAWLGRVDAGQLTWQRMAGSVAPFANAAVTSLISTGDQVIAFGWERETEAPLTWSTIGSGWVRSELPAAFGGIPQVAAAGDAGAVVVGHRPSAFGDDATVWHLSRSGAWLPERDPVIAATAEPSPADCAPVPRDALAFALVNRAVGPLCYGNASITFRAWSYRCDGCWGVGEGIYEPEWLAAPGENQLWLSPIESGAALTQVVLSSTLAAAPADEWLDTWLQVTGHFDDPSAATCRFTPPPAEVLWYSGRQWVVNACRQQFVVTEVRVVDGP